ncbi:MAG: HNH endonuclease domain-containing protein [Anaerolineae bacterium]
MKLLPGAVIPVDVLLARMIAAVWYPLHYFHLSLGKQDRLEAVARQIKVYDSRLQANASQADVVDAVVTHLSTQSPLAQEIRTIGNYVPQRFLRPFFQRELSGIEDWRVNATIESLAESAFHAQVAPCLYRFVTLPGRGIEIQPAWLEYLQQHLYILTGFCLWHLVNYIQKNNPNAPNVTGKLFRPEQRDLKQGHAFWKLVIDEIGPFQCIYSQQLISSDDFSLDHFLPWSFVAHDLLWNLVPTPKAVNARKGDQLPDISLYFGTFAQLQYEAVQAVARSNHGRLLEDYALLYKQDSVAALRSLPFAHFRQILFDTITPQVQIARNMGFAANWSYRAS